MALGFDKTYAFNTFIFNWVQNYEDQINNLKDAMESLQNKVVLYNHLTYDQLIKVVEQLTYANFELFNYIVVIILDNECAFQQYVKTSDNQNVLIHSEILTRIQTNPTLKEGIKRFFVIQKLLDCTDIDDDNADKVAEMIKQHQAKLNQSQFGVQPGLTISLRANEFSNKFSESPFVKVLSRYFRKHAKTLPMDIIYGGILKEIKYKRGYMIDIGFSSNGTTMSNLVYGDGVCGDVLRDFFY